MDLKTYFPVIARYVLGWLFAALATRGVVSPEQNDILSGNMDVIIGSVGALVTLGWALVKRPSSKGLAAAKAIDQQLPKKEDVVIKTPGQAADIIISAKS